MLQDMEAVAQVTTGGKEWRVAGTFARLDDSFITYQEWQLEGDAWKLAVESDLLRVLGVPEQKEHKDQEPLTISLGASDAITVLDQVDVGGWARRSWMMDAVAAAHLMCYLARQTQSMELNLIFELERPESDLSLDTVLRDEDGKQVQVGDTDQAWVLHPSRLAVADVPWLGATIGLRGPSALQCTDETQRGELCLGDGGLRPGCGEYCASWPACSMWITGLLRHLSWVAYSKEHLVLPGNTESTTIVPEQMRLSLTGQDGQELVAANLGPDREWHVAAPPAEDTVPKLIQLRAEHNEHSQLISNLCYAMQSPTAKRLHIELRLRGANPLTEDRVALLPRLIFKRHYGFSYGYGPIEFNFPWELTSQALRTSIRLR